MKQIIAYKVKNTNKVIRIISGGTCLSQVLSFENKKDIPVGLPVITTERAKELTGNYSLFN